MLTRRQLQKIREAIPKGDPDGLYIFDHQTGSQVFLTFDELKETCEFIMADENASLVSLELGKYDWQQDPTYNIRKK